MKNKKYLINTDKAPKAIGPYSQAVKFNNLIFTSGQIPIDPKTGLIVSEEFTKQDGTPKEGSRAKGKELLIMNYKIQEELVPEEQEELEQENKLIGEFFNNEQ